MPLGKDAYEKALGRKLSDVEYAKLSGVADGATSRDASAYVGATTMEQADKSGKKVPVERNMPGAVIVGADGKTHTLPAGVVGAEKYDAMTGRLSGQAAPDGAAASPDMTMMDYLRAEAGPNYTPAHKAEYEVGPDGKKRTVKIFDGTPDELARHVAAGNLTPADATSIYAHQNPAKPRAVFTAPRVTPVEIAPQVIKSAPAYASGMNNEPAPSMAAKAHETVNNGFDKAWDYLNPPDTKDEYGAVIQPDTEDEYGAVIANARKKWGL